MLELSWEDGGEAIISCTLVKDLMEAVLTSDDALWTVDSSWIVFNTNSFDDECVKSLAIEECVVCALVLGWEGEADGTVSCWPVEDTMDAVRASDDALWMLGSLWDINAKSFDDDCINSLVTEPVFFSSCSASYGQS